jgi:hypothetical protein
VDLEDRARPLQPLHRTEHDFGALVPYERAHEAEAQVALRILLPLESLERLRARAVVRMEEGLGIEAGLVDELLAQEPARADAEVRGLVGALDERLAPLEIGEPREGPSHRAGNEPPVPARVGEAVEERTGDGVEAVQRVGRGGLLVADAGEAAAPHVLLAARAVGSDQLDPRAERQ